MPGKGPAQYRLLITHGPFGHLGPAKAQIAHNNAVRRSARRAAAVVNDALAGRYTFDVTSDEETLEDYMEPLSEDESMEDETSDDGVLGIDLTRRPAVNTHEQENDSEEEVFQVESEEESEEEEVEEHQYVSRGTQTMYYYTPVAVSALASGPVPTPVPVPAPVSATTAANQGRQRLVPCSYCDRQFSSVVIRHQHEHDKHIGTTCHWPGCGTVTNTDDELHQHFRDHHRDAIEQGVDKNTCPWPNCGKVFSRADTVQRCLKRHNRA
ncbi:hypothetical protein EV127DRAFT_415124 [Xylaria flabelliformis]|nr:hypothetical protein EV127DRAFT_415124 [Xylaria flabelliformis]